MVLAWTRSRSKISCGKRLTRAARLTGDTFPPRFGLGGLFPACGLHPWSQLHFVDESGCKRRLLLRYRDGVEGGLARTTFGSGRTGSKLLRDCLWCPSSRQGFARADQLQAVVQRLDSPRAAAARSLLQAAIKSRQARKGSCSRSAQGAVEKRRECSLHPLLIKEVVSSTSYSDQSAPNIRSS